jgi:glutamate 5-kinase
MKTNERIVIKIGTSTLTYENGKANLRRIEQLCKVISDLQNMGKEIIVVSSGALSVGVGKMNIDRSRHTLKERQALAAVGQCELMFIYDKLFGEYNHTIAQILLIKTSVESQERRENILNTINTLLAMGVIPIINENDTVATDELEGENFGDNDMLSAIVARLVSADGLIILTDIDGLYDKNPRKFADAKLIPVVDEITDDIRAIAGGTGSNRGTGGMATKISAANYCMQSGIACRVINGSKPDVLYDVFDGKDVGTLFCKTN